MPLRGKALQAANQAMDDGRLFYVCTDQYGRSCNGGQFQHSLPTPGNPGGWSPKVDNPSICQRGYHATDDPIRWLSTLVWLAEVSNVISQQENKFVSSRIRLLGLVRPEDCLTGRMAAAVNRPNLRDVNLVGADLRSARLGGARLEDTDLRGANIRGASLRGANLHSASLVGADLRYITLVGANIRYAHLEGANLEGAHLQAAKLVGADLRDTDLRGADFRGADFRGANLSGANLVGAKFQGADIVGANFDDALWNKYTVWPDGFVPPSKT